VRNPQDAIFVGIASYCDSFLDQTLTHLFAQAQDPNRVHVGKPVQVKPMKFMLKGPGTERWNQKLLSSFAFNYNLRRYTSGSCGRTTR